MTENEKLELTTTELLARGWTRTLIKRFLPRPDGSTPVDHCANFRGQDTYSAIKVWNIEQSDTFGHAFIRSWKGRKTGRMENSTPEIVLADIRKAPHPKISPRSKDEVRRETLIMKFASILGEIRSRGYRTPHKC